MFSDAVEAKEATVFDDIERLKQRTHELWSAAKERLDSAEGQVAKARKDFNAIDEFYQPMVGPVKEDNLINTQLARPY